MRILFLTNIPSPYRVAFFEELGKSCELTVLYEKATADDRDEKWIAETRATSYKPVILKSVRETADTALCPAVKAYLKKDAYDFIVVGGYSTPTGRLAIRYMNRKRIPYWISVDGAIMKSESGFKRWTKSSLLKGASGYLSSGIATDKWLVHYGASRDAIYRYPFTSVKESDISGICTAEEKQELKQRLEIPEEKVFLFVGQFIHRKGVDLLLKAWKDMPSGAGLYVIGGEAPDEYKKLIESCALKQVHFLPFMVKEELQKYYRIADYFVMPTREDIWGLVINEAMSFGLDTITTDACLAGVEMIEDGVNGRIVQAESVDDLHQAMLEEIALSDEALSERRQNSLQTARNYTIEKMAQRHIEIWNEYSICGYKRT